MATKQNTVKIKTIDLPDRMACVNGHVCNTSRDGTIPLNALVFEGANYVLAYNAMATQRDELVEALRAALVLLDAPAISDAWGNFGPFASEVRRLHAILAKVQP